VRSHADLRVGVDVDVDVDWMGLDEEVCRRTNYEVWWRVSRRKLPAGFYIGLVQRNVRR